MERVIQPELLDELPAVDPRAVRSRCDLLRVNAWMGNGAFLSRGLRQALPRRAPRRLAELGAGDGRQTLKVASRLNQDWRDVLLTLIDRQKLLAPETQNGFSSGGWQVESVQADALVWLENAAGPAPEAVMANLFLHHFPDRQLRRLFQAAADKAQALVAVEPRRAPLPLLFSRLLWLIGCNAITRHDAVVSVRAGFVRGELSALWPKDENWELTELSAGLFSLLFIARRVNGVSQFQDGPNRRTATTL